MKFELNGEFIRLGDLLKAAGLTGTGGEAKQAVQDGLVNVWKNNQSSFTLLQNF